MTFQSGNDGPYLSPGFTLPRGETNTKSVIEERENKTAYYLAQREIALYSTATAQPTGQKWFTSLPANSRSPLRTVINFGALPNSGTSSAAHNIAVNSMTTLTKLYGSASDTTDELYIPIPYASATTAKIVELHMDETYVYVTTNGNLTNYNVCYIVIEWLTN